MLIKVSSMSFAHEWILISYHKAFLYISFTLQISTSWLWVTTKKLSWLPLNVYDRKFYICFWCKYQMFWRVRKERHYLFWVLASVHLPSSPCSSLEFLGLPWSSLTFFEVPWSFWEFFKVTWSSLEFLKVSGVIFNSSEELLGAP